MPMVSPDVFRLCCVVALTLRHSVAGSTIRRHVRGGVAIQSNVTADWSNATVESSPSTVSSALAAAVPKRPSLAHRALVEDHNFFVPLTCNTIPCSVKKSNWTLEDYAAQTEMVVIPCGHCILLDYMMDEETSLTVNGRSASSARTYPSPRNVTLELPFGIDIQGSLYIPGNAHQYNRLTIVTPFVRVQGKLSIKAHMNGVGAVPNVKFLFTDNPNVETTFVPTGNNVYACSNTQSGSPTPCIVGPKSLVVAGGQLHIRGLATKCASWVYLYDVVDRPSGLRSDIIVRDQGVWGCWGRGAQILITSHTPDFESAQLRTIIAEPTLYGRGLVRLSLDDLVVPSVTLRHNDSFAVEVALLSRNILFEAAPDASDPLLGGHLTIMNTPTVVQIIQGVEIRNFGRQGEIGRYPIHFHLSDSVFGSVVAKNSIRNSNQRCVVAHGTHNLTITNNVAHETAGHCFMLEDGGERHNSFIRNLGASTRAATRLVRPFETDASNPSTFWCSNPVNTWIGNVAAGGANSGFWFELQRMVRPPTSLMKSSIGLPSPRQLRLKLFVDNVAHSNAEHGLRTYPFGFKPPVQAVFDNTRSYKNNRAGVFFHESFDMKLLNGVLADNSIQADLDRADSIEINGTEIVGSTARFNEIVATQRQRYGHEDQIIGVQLHSFVFNETKLGGTLVNVRFSGFEDAVSSRVALLDVDVDRMSGHFDYWTTLQGTQVTNSTGVAVFDFRRAAAVGITDIAVIDMDSGLKPKGSSAVGISSVISNSSQMTSFVDVAKSCHDFSSLGYYYCRRTCFRSVTFATSPSETESLVLRVTNLSNPSQTGDFRGFYNTETVETDGQSPEQRNTWILKYRYFVPSVPQGRYSAQFVDTRTEEVVWPTFVSTTIEQQECSRYPNISPIRLEVPTPGQSQCRELVRNGRMDVSNTAYPYWLHAETGIELVRGGGLDGTNAISDIDQTRSSRAYIGQFLDTRCLTLGSQYVVSAWYKLVDPTSKSLVVCDRPDGTCPSVVLRYRVPLDPRGQEFEEIPITVAFNVISKQDGWSLLQSTMTVDAALAGASSVALVVVRQQANVKIYLDNVSMSRLE